MRILVALVAVVLLLIVLRDLVQALLYNLWPVVGIVAAVVAIVMLIRVGQHYDWTGFGESTYPKSDTQEIRPRKTLWDWLQLLIVPLGLALLGLWLTTAWQASTTQEVEDRRAQAQQELEAERAQDAALQSYLEAMRNLLLEEGLRTSGPDSSVRAVANVETLLILERVDEVRKRSVLRLLNDSRLIDANTPLIDLDGANLEGAYVSGMDLSGTDLSDANLKGADLEGAKLKGANLEGANLKDAYLSGARGVTNEQLEQQAASLKGATMPNGQKYEEWLKSKGSGEE
jgi:hypothetical protein